jgi:NADPH:quinone reductase-like Zn-dependent oxidoreductase
MMRAVQIREYGPIDSLAIDSSVPTPSAGEGQVLVNVRASSVNPIDPALRLGYMKEMMPLTFPATLGTDFAGTVSEVGPGVNAFKPGDSVFGSASILMGGSGAFAEVATVGAGQIAFIPSSLDFTQAAALPLTGVSAVQALEESLKIRSGQSVLIHGGAGGIGTVAIQLAKHLGATVTTTVLAGSEDYVRSLGADNVIVSGDDGPVLPQAEYDAVYDTLGGNVYTASFGALKRGGSIVSMLSQPDEELAQRHEVTAQYQFTGITTERLRRLAALVDEGVITVHVHRVFPLHKLQEALALQGSGKAHGKVVLEV